MIEVPRRDFESQVPAAMRATRLPVFYATTRARAEDGHYGNADGGGVTLGVAAVRRGEPGMTWEQQTGSHRASHVEHPRPGAVAAGEQVGRDREDGSFGETEERFVAAVDAQIAKGNNRELIIHFHRYRVAFDAVAVPMGSFSHDLGQGARITFQWPTGAMFWNDLTDCARAERNTPQIERLPAIAGRT